MSLREMLERIKEELVKKDGDRQEIQRAMRKATHLSKQAIFLVHKAKIEEAENTLREAERIFSTVSDLSKSFQDLFYMGAVDAAFQEYAEAHVFLKLVKERRFVNFEEINIPTVPYVLGLADVIGEFRRRALDFLRKGETERAEECLELMETTYIELINFDELQFLIQGLRRKCDVAKKIIEATRGDITIEVRRKMLENSIRELKETLEAKKSL